MKCALMLPFAKNDDCLLAFGFKLMANN